MTETNHTGEVTDLPPSFNDMMNASHLYIHEKKDKCVFNEHGQCIKGFRYFCSYCGFGLGGMFSKCGNKNCLMPKLDVSDIND